MKTSVRINSITPRAEQVVSVEITNKTTYSEVFAKLKKAVEDTPKRLKAIEEFEDLNKDKPFESQILGEEKFGFVNFVFYDTEEDAGVEENKI